MRSAAPSQWEHRSTLIRTSRWLAAFVAFGLSGACSVYTSDLLEATTGITTAGNSSSGSSSHAGAPGGSTSNAEGGKPGTVTTSEGGEGGDSTASPGTAGATGGMGTTGGSGTPGTAGGGTGGTGTAGTSATAGSAGTGGGPVGDGNLLDDFEDENLTIEQTDTRGGVWYTFTDGTTGTIAPSPLVVTANSGAPADLGGFAMHITATGFTSTGTVGSGLGVDFRNLKKVYDASKFTGIRFWAKVGAGKNTKHRVQIADATTDKAGGKCNPAADAVNGEKCDDHFGIGLTFTATWAQYTVRFDKLTQIGWGNPADALDTAAVYGLQITAAPKAAVDLWLDQIEFF
jgi:hypothetical protein